MWASQNEDIVTAFIEASNLGWLWAIKNTTAAGSLVFNAEDTANTVSEYHQQYEASEIAKLVEGDIIDVDDPDTYVMIGYLDDDKYAQTYDILSKYVDVKNIEASSTYTSYFYDLITEDEVYLAALASIDDYVWDGDYEVLYEEA